MGLRPWTLEECIKLLRKTKKDLGIIEHITNHLIEKKPPKHHVWGLKSLKSGHYWETIGIIKDNETLKIDFNNQLKDFLIDSESGRLCLKIKIQSSEQTVSKDG